MISGIRFTDGKARELLDLRQRLLLEVGEARWRITLYTKELHATERREEFDEATPYDVSHIRQLQLSVQRCQDDITSAIERLNKVEGNLRTVLNGK